MKFRKSLCALILALFSLQTFQFTALADEGMWPFNNVPRAEIKRKYGFDITDEWLHKVQMAAVRFNNGGSGSFVSPTGLVLTNYHIVEDFVGELSTPAKDYAKDGFIARTRAEEMKIPNLELNVLMSIEDVTNRVNGAVKAGTSDADAFAARRAATRESSGTGCTVGRRTGRASGRWRLRGRRFLVALLADDRGDGLELVAFVQVDEFDAHGVSTRLANVLDGRAHHLVTDGDEHDFVFVLDGEGAHHAHQEHHGRHEEL